MLESNELDLGKSVAEKRRNAQSERTVEMYVRFMTELDETINRPLREAAEGGINHFVDMKARYCSKKSMVLCKTAIETFYKWLFELKDTHPPAVCIYTEHHARRKREKLRETSPP